MNGEKVLVSVIFCLYVANVTRSADLTLDTVVKLVPMIKLVGWLKTNMVVGLFH